MNINIKIIENYKDDENLIIKYHEFISQVFPNISFEEWHRKGFWIENYIPYSILKDDKIIANVSVALMKIIWRGEKLNAIQIGAVGTLPEYRNQGISRYITNYVIEKYKNKVDLIFLFANDTVMKFYPKFGFRNIEENVFVSESNIPEPKFSARKLNVKVESDYTLLEELINNRHIITKIFGAENYGFITMWHVLNLYYNDLYYLEDDNIIFIKTEENNTVHIIDIIYREPFDFQLVLQKFIDSNNVKFVKYYFPPDQLAFKYNKILKKNMGLFILGDIELETELFKFPETAHT